MAGLTVDYYTSLAFTFKSTGGKLTLTDRSQGFEWNTTAATAPKGTLPLGYKMIAFIPKIGFSPIKVILNGNNSYISDRFYSPDNQLLLFSEPDVMKLYNFLCEKMEWSPEAISEGTAHPNLMAASDRFSTGKRRTRKTRK